LHERDATALFAPAALATAALTGVRPALEHAAWLGKAARLHGDALAREETPLLGFTPPLPPPPMSLAAAGRRGAYGPLASFSALESGLALTEMRRVLLGASRYSLN
ncbi:hypothetical protein T492DRAFT_869594, partial [Pavlovales sp. CCMP2436]